jgi:signal transduction histidine kinase
MNNHLQHILDTLQQIENLSEEQKATITKSLKDADKEMTITAFKLDRTEKVKRTTAILLEETIEELELKRKAVEESNLALQKSLEDLKAAQEQLVQQEKLASLGQLTAGIAHEIKNPLNFVNNFSDVSIEMIDEALEELQQIGENAHAIETAAILDDIKSNLAKIHEHGSRADGIVKSMLMHSRGGDGKMEPTPLNPIIKEYVNLAFHGMRAGKEPINVDIDLQLDESVGEVPLIAEDFSRVILNLVNNAFDAMRSLGAERSAHGESYSPKLTVTTKSENGQILIEVQDNGPGIPDEIKDKIMQPFFTTKKGTQGTGLGLSITNDIIKAHGGNMTAANLEKSGARFTINLPSS